MTSVLVTLIFLLANGAPAREAWVSCPQIPTYLSGDDTGALIHDAHLLLDARGATILIMEPGTLTCSARQGDQWWTGDIAVINGRNVIRVHLK